MLQLTKPQLKRFSNILDNAGQVLLGSLILNPLLNPTNISGVIIAVGVPMTLVIWWGSLKFERVSL